MNNLISVSGRISNGKDLVGSIIQYLVWQNELGNSIGYETTYKDYLRLKPGGYTGIYQIKKFADKLKDIVCLLIGCTREQLEDREFKEKELGEEWWRYKIHDGSVFRWATLEEYTKEGKYQKFIVKLTPRKLLQLLGTECGRQILHPNIWVNSLFSEWKPLPKQKSGHILDIDFNFYMGICEVCQEKFYSKNKYQRLCLKHWEEEVKYPNWIITDTRFPNELQAVKDRGGVTIRVERYCYDSLEDYLVTHPDKEVSKKAIKIVNDWGLNRFGLLKEKLKEIPEAKGYLNRSLHKSETSLDNEFFDFTLTNTGTIEELITKVKDILVEIKVINK